MACGLALSLALLASAAPERPPRVYDLRHVRWQIALDPITGQIQGEVTNTIVPLQPKTAYVWFDCGPLSIKSVSVNGKPAQFKQPAGSISITLPTAAGPADKLDVKIVYSGRPDRGLYFTPSSRTYPASTPMVWTQGQPEDTRCYIPTYDYPDDKATSEGLIEAPSDWTVLSNGKLLATKPKGANKLWHFKMDQPHSTYLISIVAGPMVRKDEMWGSIPVRYFVPPGLEEMGASSFAGTDKMVDHFSKLLGVPYPYPVFSQAVIPDYMYGGMENITAVTNTIKTLQPPDWRPLKSSKGLVLHELAHQWFGDLVTCKDWSHAWINEGFASFLPAIWTRDMESVDQYDLGRLDTLNGAIGAITAKGWSVVSTKYEHPSDMFDGNAYGGGSARMYVLMHELGEPVFWKAVQNFLNEYKFKNANTDDFFSSVGKTAGRDLTQFKKQWFYTAETPKLVLTRDKGELVIAQAQKTPFELKLPVWIWTGSEWQKKSVAMKGKEARVPLGDYMNSAVLVDPEVWYIAEIEDQSPGSVPNLKIAWDNAPNIAQKGRLLDRMEKALKPAEFLELAKNEKSATMLRRMLAKVQDVPFLIEVSKSDEPLLSDEATVQLGNRKDVNGNLTRLKEIWEGHPHPHVRQSAFYAMMKLTKDEALVERAWGMKVFDDSYRIYALRWWRDNKPDEARERALQVVAKPDSELLRQAAIEVLGVVKDKPKERRVFDALIGVVKERLNLSRKSAVDALGNYGDPTAINYLKPLQENTHLFMRRAATEAVKKLTNK